MRRTSLLGKMGLQVSLPEVQILKFLCSPAYQPPSFRWLLLFHQLSGKESSPHHVSKKLHIWKGPMNRYIYLHRNRPCRTVHLKTLSFLRQKDPGRRSPHQPLFLLWLLVTELFLCARPADRNGKGHVISFYDSLLSTRPHIELSKIQYSGNKVSLV